jgi:hypothetical protein
MPPSRGSLTLAQRMSLPDPERSEAPSSTPAQPRCVVCHEVIGVYEPLVHVSEGSAWRTSRAAEPGVMTTRGELYHADCYERSGHNYPSRPA